MACLCVVDVHQAWTVSGVRMAWTGVRRSRTKMVQDFFFLNACRSNSQRQADLCGGMLNCRPVPILKNRTIDFIHFSQLKNFFFLFFIFLLDGGCISGEKNILFLFFVLSGTFNHQIFF